MVCPGKASGGSRSGVGLGFLSRSMEGKKGIILIFIGIIRYNKKCDDLQSELLGSMNES